VKAILPLLPLLLAGAAFGADGAIAPGFQLGLGWVLPDDRRFSGTTVDFYLFLAPEATVDLGYLREEMFLTGRDDGETVTERGHYDAMRVRFRLYDDEIQSARLLADAGYAWFSLNHPVGAWAFDLGAEYVPWKIASGAVKTEVAIQLRYRYCRFHPIETFGDAGRPVDDAGGFMAGIAGDVRF
jgi:hypothetical protein